MPPLGEDFVEVARRHLQALSGQGFVETSARYDAEAFGNALVELRSPELRIRLVRDRSQLFVSVAPEPAPERWFDLAVLAAWLGRREMAEAISAAMPPFDEMASAEPEAARIRTLAGSLQSLLPELRRSFAGPGWAESIRALETFRF